MVYEGMNNAGIMKKDMIVILNDNNMSIAPNVWAISNYFTELIANPRYNRLKANVYELTGKLDAWGDRIRRVAARVEEGIKTIVTPGMLFEALGFRYFGPVNGHNITQLVHILKEVKDLPGPILVHVTTEKGKGYKPAEEDIQKLHGVSPFDKVTGLSPKKADGPPAYTKVFGQAVVELAREDPTIVGVTAAMPDGTGLDQLQAAFPGRFYDVGIAEQHGVTFAAGLATEGCTPIVAIYSTFLQRAFDQIIHDVALQHLHVVFALDRAGLVGADGPTHHGAFDLSYLRMIPGMVIMCPKDEAELRDMLYTAVQYKDGPVALRYPRGNGSGVPMREGFAAAAHRQSRDPPAREARCGSAGSGHNGGSRHAVPPDFLIPGGSPVKWLTCGSSSRWIWNCWRASRTVFLGGDHRGQCDYWRVWKRCGGVLCRQAVRGCA